MFPERHSTITTGIFDFKQHGRSRNETTGNQKPLAKISFDKLLLICQIC